MLYRKRRKLAFAYLIVGASTSVFALSSFFAISAHINGADLLYKAPISLISLLSISVALLVAQRYLLCDFAYSIAEKDGKTVFEIYKIKSSLSSLSSSLVFSVEISGECKLFSYYPDLPHYKTVTKREYKGLFKAHKKNIRSISGRALKNFSCEIFSSDRYLFSFIDPSFEDGVISDAKSDDKNKRAYIIITVGEDFTSLLKEEIEKKK